jgi:hypothetical protein
MTSRDETLGREGRRNQQIHRFSNKIARQLQSDSRFAADLRPPDASEKCLDRSNKLLGPIFEAKPVLEPNIV